MSPLEVKLHHKQISMIANIVNYEEPRVIKRANILSCLHNGMTSGQIANILHVDPKTVRNIAHHYLENGIDAALFDESRLGRPIDIDDRDRSRIIAMVCSNPPDSHKRWTLDLIVEEVDKRNLINKKISKESIRVILHEHELKPWQEKMWCIEEITEDYAKRMEDVLDTYEKKHDELRPVVCIDEKPVPLISDKRDRIPASPGNTAKKDYEYSRNGSVNVFCGVEPKKGVYFNKVTERRDAENFTYFLKDLSDHYHKAEKIVLVMDNLSTHTLNSLIRTLGEEEGKRLWERFEIHYTPKHASWLNQAEIAIGMYSRQCLGDGRLQGLDHLMRITKAWNKYTNDKGTLIQWRFTTEKARKSLKYR